MKTKTFILRYHRILLCGLFVFSHYTSATSGEKGVIVAFSSNANIFARIVPWPVKIDKNKARTKADIFRRTTPTSYTKQSEIVFHENYQPGLALISNEGILVMVETLIRLYPMIETTAITIYNQDGTPKIAIAIDDIYSKVQIQSMKNKNSDVYWVCKTAHIFKDRLVSYDNIGGLLEVDLNVGSIKYQSDMNEDCDKRI